MDKHIINTRYWTIKANGHYYHCVAGRLDDAIKLLGLEAGSVTWASAEDVVCDTRSL